MPKIREAFVKCTNVQCGFKFRAPIHIDSTELWDRVVTEGNVTNCPKCGNVFRCDKTNMSYITEDGKAGGVGEDFGR